MANAGRDLPTVPARAGLVSYSFLSRTPSISMVIATFSLTMTPPVAPGIGPL